MQDYIVVATFTLPTQLAVAQSKLESEGIASLSKDELTIQSHNFLSNAVGGVKLLVHISEAEKAKTILNEGGFVTTGNAELTQWEKLLGNPKTFKRIKAASLILLLLAALMILIIGFTAY